MATTQKRRIGTIAVYCLLALVIVVVLVLCVAAWKTHQFISSDVIAENVFVQGVNVSGLRPSEAVDRIRREWVAGLPPLILLKYHGGASSVTRDDLGVRLDIDGAVAEAVKVGRTGTLWQLLWHGLRGNGDPVQIRVATVIDAQRLKAAVEQIAKKANRPPRDARVRVRGEKVEVIPETPGVVVDVQDSVATLRKVLAEPEASEAKLVVRTTAPAIRAAQLKGFDTVLARYSTSFNSSDRNRTQNLRLAASLVNETVMLPGQTFSLNARLGPRTMSRGFEKAGTIVDGELVPTPGGGVCQIATTIYNAVLLAGMQVTERHHHSRPIPYTPAGRDATVSWGGQDLKFRNNLKHPVILLVATEGNRLRASLLGNHEDKVDVELIRSGFKSIPRAEKEVVDPTLPPGTRKVEKSGRDGVQVTLRRVIRKDGKVLKDEVLHTDVYRPETRVIRVGPPVPLAAAGKAETASPPTAKPAKPEAKPTPRKPAASSAKPSAASSKHRS